MEIATIRRMAKRGTLEVEHLLRLAKAPSEELATNLGAIAAEMGWELGTQLPFVPFGDWVAVIQQFCRGGYDGLATYATQPSKFGFVIGLLEEVRGAHALLCAEQILNMQATTLVDDPERATKLAGAFSRLGGAMEKEAGYVAVEDIENVRAFLHAQVSSHPQEVGRAIAMGALRCFGDSESLALIRSAPQMADFWEPVRHGAIRTITKRLRRRSQAS